jgi:O-antigen biosynthesis protein WbqP
MIRGLDVVVALLGLVCSAPVIAVCALIHHLTSRGSAIFAQTRVGRGEAPFVCYKLRTMTPDTPNLGTHEVSGASVTPLGGVLRKLKLDELPQLWNVLIGEMSLVGPRPCLPSQDAVIAARRAKGVFIVRPGVTGPAQVTGVDMSTPERLAEVDASWVANQSVAEYVRIVVATAGGRGFGDKIKQ